MLTHTPARLGVRLVSRPPGAAPPATVAPPPRHSNPTGHRAPRGHSPRPVLSWGPSSSSPPHSAQAPHTGTCVARATRDLPRMSARRPPRWTPSWTPSQGSSRARRLPAWLPASLSAPPRPRQHQHSPGMGEECDPSAVLPLHRPRADADLHPVAHHRVRRAPPQHVRIVELDASQGGRHGEAGADGGARARREGARGVELGEAREAARLQKSARRPM